MSYAFFIDTTQCTGCRGCQVACKQWHDLPAEKTVNQGSYQNPPDLSDLTYKLVRMREEVLDGRLRWLFFPDQCRHCVEPPCRDAAGEPSAIYKDEATGAVLYTANTRFLDAAEIIESCPYDIPRKAPNKVLVKCDMCIDRVVNGLQPSCVKVCPTGTMNFGTREEIMAMAQERLGQVKKKFPQASLLDPDDVSVVFLTAFEPKHYHSFAVAAAETRGISRQLALRRLLRPVRRSAAQVARIL